MLVVGKGSLNVGSDGGGSGMVIYKKNLEISSFYQRVIESIEFNRETFYGPKITGTEIQMTFIEVGQKVICAQNASGRNGADTPYYYMSNTDLTSELDGWGSGGGGGTYRASGMSVYYNYGGAGSNGNADNAELGWNKGGDGSYGYHGAGQVYSQGFTKGVVIPVTSIFGGTGKGGYPNTGTTYGCSGGAAGYGNGGGDNSGGLKGGYGAGNGYNGSMTMPTETSSGIVCLYYHNDPI